MKFKPGTEIVIKSVKNKKDDWMIGSKGKVLKNYNDDDFVGLVEIDEGKVELRFEQIELLNKNKNLGGNIMKSILSQLDNYLIKDENISLTPTGLSFNNKTYSKENKSMVNTKGTDIIKNIPVGIVVPTPLEEIESGDIILTEEDEYLKVQVCNKAQVTALSYSTQQIKAVTPNLDILGNKTYKKLATPFTYDGGVNPVLNIFITVFNSYQNDNLENLLEDNKHLITSQLSKFNFKDLVDSKAFKTILPLGLVGYELLNLDLEQMSVKDIKQKVKEVDKETLVLILLGLSFLIYTNQDKIKKMMLKLKVKLQLKKIKGQFTNMMDNVKEFFTKE